MRKILRNESLFSIYEGLGDIPPIPEVVELIIYNSGLKRHLVFQTQDAFLLVSNCEYTQ